MDSDKVSHIYHTDLSVDVESDWYNRTYTDTAG